MEYTKCLKPKVHYFAVDIIFLFIENVAFT